MDVTADETTPLLVAGLEHGFDLVLANKKPLAGSEANYRRLHETAEATGRRLLYEATVGAGLPVIDTFRKLVASGDRILRVDGCVSGTLGYVLSAVEAGEAFSAVVREAVDKGYAEPDPRDDLLGRDAGRKGLILARLLGYHGVGPVPEPLVPASFARLPLDAFFRKLPLPGRGLAPAGRARGRPGPRPALRGRGHRPRGERPLCSRFRGTRTSGSSAARATAWPSRPGATRPSPSRSEARAPGPRSPPPAS